MKFRKKFIIFTIIFLSFLTLLILSGIGFGIYVASKMFEDKPLKFKNLEGKNTGIFAVSEISNLIYYQMITSKPGELKSLVLDKDQVNSMFFMAGFYFNQQLNMMTGDKDEKKKDSVQLIFDNDRIYVYWSESTGSNPFGEYFNTTAEMVPVVRDGKLDVKILYYKVGELEIPLRFAYLLFNQKMESNLISQVFIDSLFGSLKNIKIKDNKLYITYYPAQTRELLSQFIDTSVLKNFFPPGALKPQKPMNRKPNSEGVQ